jgi:hypothetical protein
MNRHERRAARSRGGWKKDDVLETHLGHFRESYPGYGLPANCYLCGAMHPARGVALVTKNRTDAEHYALCDPCLAADPDSVCGAIARKFMNAPDLITHDAGEISDAQIEAVIERQSAVEH